VTERGAFKMGTICRMTGLSPVLLRAWERRYGILQPARGPGGHRLYTSDDLRVLRQAQSWIRSGRSIGEVAAMGREALLRSEAAGLPTSPNQDILGEQLRRLVHAALDLDAGALNQTLDQVAATVSTEQLFEAVIVPAAREIGDLWESGKCSVASEHLASSIFAHRLRKLLESAGAGPNRNLPVALAACLPEEDHQLGLLMISYFLQRNGVRVLCLGARLPLEDLRHAFRSTGPDAVLLSVTRTATFRKYRPVIGEVIEELDSGSRFYLGGAGAPESDPELEATGLRLTPHTESAADAAVRISGELARTS
jgi:MerR family transcriptional regulator, light-induced transcriptional regulator